MELEESLRRLARSLHGGLTHKRKVSARGRIDSGRTMRRNMRFDGIPFAPVTVRRAEDKPRLVILADVSLSVRATARFTLHLVHGLQSLFGQVRTFAFVAELAEVTDLFADHPVEQALGLIFGGDVLDVDANSDYGAAFGRFHEDFGSAVNRRSTVIILGDGRGNGNDRRRRGVRRDHPARPRDDLAHARTPLLLGPRRLRPAGVRGVLLARAGGARPHRSGERGGGDGDGAGGSLTTFSAASTRSRSWMHGCSSASSGVGVNANSRSRTRSRSAAAIGVASSRRAAASSSASRPHSPVPR